jgi:Nucleotidyltransferase domain.
MKDVMEMLRRYFKDKAQVKMAYLFGSMASERGGPLSDIDIGVLLDDDLDRVERSKVKLELISELTSLLKSDRI